MTMLRSLTTLAVGDERRIRRGLEVAKRQQHGNGRTFTDLALNLDVSAVGFGNPGANRQSKARALLRMGSRVIGAIEPVEDLSLIFLRDPDAVICHRHPSLPLLNRQGHVDRAAWPRVFDCVIDEVQEQFAQT